MRKIIKYLVLTLIGIALLHLVSIPSKAQTIPVPDLVTPYPTNTEYPTQIPYPTQSEYPTQVPYDTQTPYPTATFYPTQQPFTPTPITLTCIDLEPGPYANINVKIINGYISVPNVVVDIIVDNVTIHTVNADNNGDFESLPFILLPGTHTYGCHYNGTVQFTNFNFVELTSTPTPTNSVTPSATPSPIHSATSTVTRTNTPIPPTPTHTLTDTPIPPTPVPTNTPTFTPTDTPVPIPTFTDTPLPTTFVMEIDNCLQPTHTGIGDYVLVGFDLVNNALQPISGSLNGSAGQWTLINASLHSYHVVYFNNAPCGTSGSYFFKRILPSGNVDITVTIPAGLYEINGLINEEVTFIVPYSP